MPDRPVARAFTARYEALSRVLRTQEVGISKIQALAIAERPAPRTYSAIWDTGATHTNVTTRVVRECGLVPTGVAEVTGVHGTQRTNVYLIDVYLPNRVVVGGVGAVETPSLPEVDDVLIGMDIIGLGDFAVSNFQGQDGVLVPHAVSGGDRLDPSASQGREERSVPLRQRQEVQEVPRLTPPELKARVRTLRPCPATALPPAGGLASAPRRPWRLAPRLRIRGPARRTRRHGHIRGRQSERRPKTSGWPAIWSVTEHGDDALAEADERGTGGLRPVVVYGAVTDPFRRGLEDHA